MIEGELYRVGELVSTRQHFEGERDKLKQDLKLVDNIAYSQHAKQVFRNAIEVRINEINEALKDGKANDGATQTHSEA